MKTLKSSQQSTLTSYFKKKPEIASNSENTAVLPSSSQENCVKSTLKEDVVPNEIKNYRTSQKSYHVGPSKRNVNLPKQKLDTFLVKSPAKLKRELKHLGTGKKAASARFSPLKDLKLYEAINVPCKSPSKESLCIQKPSLPNIEGCALRRSPRKKLTPLNEFENRIATSTQISKPHKPTPSVSDINVINLLDETDDSYFASFVSPVKLKPETPKKRSRKNSDSSPKAASKKIRSLCSDSPDKKCKSPLKLGKENSFKNDPLFNDGLSFLSEMLDTDSSDGIDLSQGSRCKVATVGLTSEGDLLVILKCLLTSSVTKCTLQYPWNKVPVEGGDLVSVKACKTDRSGWLVSDKGGTWFVIHSDVLVSCTTVVGSLFCPRRSVLNHLFKEIPSKSQASAMFVGNIVHQLLQQALKNNLTQKQQIQELYNDAIQSQEFIKMVFLQGMDFEKIKETTSTYLPRIIEFIHSYVAVERKTTKELNPKNWPGEITQINDIEENIWIPQLGLKGKIDATVQVKIHSKTKVMPLELKTGKTSNSAEHRGQVILYCMMLNHIGIDTADSGLLLYLKDGSLKEVKGGDIERRDLLMLRNELASRIQRAIKASGENGLPSLPPPLDWKSVCQDCPQLIACTSVLRKSGETEHPLSAMIPEKTSHLTDKHLNYIFNWLRLISLEMGQVKQSTPIWANSADIRESEGTCVGGLRVEGTVKIQNAKVEVTLTRNSPIKQGVLEEGQYVIVSSDTQVAIATGHVQLLSSSCVTLLIERDISKIKLPFHIDRCESNNTSTLYLSSFLSILLDDSSKSDQLRRLIIDLELPKFATKLSSTIKKRGEKAFSTINRDQVRAICQVLSADSFIIIKGMPGTGKSKTVAALIEILTLLGHSILVTSHTHSAVDNILLRLPDSLTDRVIRLAPSNRVHPKIRHLTERSLLASKPNMSLDELSSFYTSKSIVGVTCLGALHQLVLKKEFDYCILDEATQICQPETLAALFSSKKFVLIGDPHQLPPLVISEKAKELGMGISLLERLDRPAVTTSLTLQYRMNQTIMSLANSFTYSNLLKCANEQVASATIKFLKQPRESWAEWMVKVCSSELSDSVVVINISVEDQANQNINEKEASAIKSAVSSLIEVGIKETDIGVMSPYRAQVSLISSLLSETCYNQVEVSTVDQYQGRDKPVIFFSATRNKHMVPGSNDILGDKNRLTVAITRAKHKMIIVGNVQALMTYPVFKSLFSFIDKSKFVKPTEIS